MHAWRERFLYQDHAEHSEACKLIYNALWAIFTLICRASLSVCAHFSTPGVHLETKNHISNWEVSCGAAGLRVWCRACGDEITASVAGTWLMESTGGITESRENELDGEQRSTRLLDTQQWGTHESLPSDSCCYCWLFFPSTVYRNYCH